MRIHQNPRGSASQGVTGKLSMPSLPLEWLDAGSWRLPSGKALAEFALQAGFLAPLLFKADRLDSRTSDYRKTGTLEHGAALSLGKHSGRGNGQ
jgi:hypothetical protein